MGALSSVGTPWSAEKRKKPTIIIYYKRNLPIAIVEAKDNKHSIGAGMQQGFEYAEILDIPLVYS